MLVYPGDKIKEGSRFIDLNKDFNEVKLMSVGRMGSLEELHFIWSEFPDRPAIAKIVAYKGVFFPDLNSRATILFGRYIEHKKLYAKLLQPLANKIYTAPYKKIDVTEATEFYLRTGKVDKDEAVALLKLSIAKGFLSFERQKGGDFLKLSQAILDFENRKKFLQAIADEISSKSERIELLIDHSGTKGSYREEILRGVIKKYLPNRYEIATGFIDGCKRQCDIIIYDKENFSPLFREGDLVVVPDKAVRAVIEVKSTMDPGQLQAGIALIADVARQINTPAPIFKGIFAFKPQIQESTIAETLKRFYLLEDPSGMRINDISFLFEPINCICVLNEQCLITDLMDYKFEDDSIRPRIYSVHSDNKEQKVYCAQFFNELFSFLDVDKHAKKVNINYFKSLDNDVKYRLEAEVYDIDWLPSSAFQNEHDFTHDAIWERVSDIINWKIGNYTIQDLEEKYFSTIFAPIDYRAKFRKTTK